MSAPSNDIRQNATPILIAATGGTYTSPSVLNTELTFNSDGAMSASSDDWTYSGFRTAWWKYQPVESGTLTLTAKRTGGVKDVYCFPYEADPSTGDRYSVYTGFSATSSSSFDVTAGRTYYINMMQFEDETGVTYDLSATGPRTDMATPVVPLTVPPVRVTAQLRTASANQPDPRPGPVRAVVHMSGRVDGAADVVSVAPITAHVRVKVFAADVIAPITASAVLPVPTILDVAIYLTQPDDGETVANHRPEFIIGLQQHDESLSYTIELQYAAVVDDFTNPVTLSYTLPGGSDGLWVTPDADIPDVTIWRVRLLLDGVEQIGWSTPRTLIVAPAAVPTTLPVTWTIDNTQPREIHLWHFDPPGALAGQVVTAYGQGFPLATGQIVLDTTLISPMRWELVPASPETPGVIDGGVVDPEHFEVDFIAPNISGGGAVTVEAL